MATKRKSLQDTEQEPSRKRPDSSAAQGGTAPKFSMGLGNKTAGTAADTKPKAGLSFGLMKSKASPAPVKMTLPVQTPTKERAFLKPKTGISSSSAFNQDEDSDEEEMPPEARMRMKNVGRNTPTAAGPNSYGKSKMGFCDRNKIIEREMTQLAREDDKPS